MAFSITVTSVEARLHVVATGDAGLAEFIGLADLVSAIARGHGHRRVLIDLLGVHPHLAFTEHLQLGTYLGELAKDIDRIATVVPASQRTGASEKAAQKTGIGLRTFTDTGAALDWLIGG
jgi:hypothetical protein